VNVIKTVADLIQQFHNEVQISLRGAANADDGEAYINWATTGVLTLGKESGLGYKGWLRFPNVAIPKGATIVSAVLRACSDSNYSLTTVSVRIFGNAIDNASNPANQTAYNALALTAAYADWTGIGSWSAGVFYNSPDLKSIVQEIVNRAAWSSGNALMLLPQDNGSTNNSYRRLYSYDSYGGDAARRPELIVVYA